MNSMLRRALPGALIACLVAGTAHAGATGGYIGLGGGFSSLKDGEYDTEVTSTSGGLLGNQTVVTDADFEAEYDDGFIGNLTLGYIFKGPWRVELELRYGKNDFEMTSGAINGEPEDAQITSQALMGNIWYDFNRRGRLHPYIGGGIGSAKVEVEELAFAPASDGQLDGSDHVFAYQGGAGIAFDITPRFTVDLGYRYFEATNLQFKDDDVDSEFEYEQNVALLSFRYVFNATGGIDSDGDGVFDEDDRCADTPDGVSVDSRGCPVDADGDNVPDFKDQCPNTASGEKVDSKGCPLDSDGDGVTDVNDDCPDTPEGALVDGKGCVKVVDSDGDGVPDEDDDCPGTPPGQEVTSNGCAVAQKFVVEGIKYNYESAQLTTEAQSKLDQVAQTLKDSPGFRIQLSGHTDAKGTESYNQKLSQARAESARSYLVSKGVAADRIVAKGFGESQPIAPNTKPDGSDNPEGRAKNRRTEVKILDN